MKEWIVTINDCGDAVRYPTSTHGILINHDSGILQVYEKMWNTPPGARRVVAAFKEWLRAEEK